MGDSDGQAAPLMEKQDMEEVDLPPVIQSPPSYSNATAPEVAVVKGGVASTGATRTMPTDPSLNTIYLAVFAMLFCLWPCGLVGLILGIQAMQEYYRGQYEDSGNTDKKARKWVMCSIISGIVLAVTVFVVVVVAQAVTYSIIFGRNDDD